MVGNIPVEVAGTVRSNETLEAMRRYQFRLAQAQFCVGERWAAVGSN